MFAECPGFLRVRFLKEGGEEDKGTPRAPSITGAGQLSNWIVGLFQAQLSGSGH